MIQIFTKLWSKQSLFDELLRIEDSWEEETKTLGQINGMGCDYIKKVGPSNGGMNPNMGIITL